MRLARIGILLATVATISVGWPSAQSPAPQSARAVVLTRIRTFTAVDQIVSPPGDRRRMFVVERQGTVRVLVDGVLQPRPFLDIRKLITPIDWEEGLFSLAFAPDYARSGRFYVFYADRSRPGGNSAVVEYRRANADRADPGSARRILHIKKPGRGHFGGMLQFGPGGYLYVAVGDGDVKGLHSADAQTLGELLGDILRIDPLHGNPYSIPRSNPFVGISGKRAEVWDYGLRNPWRFWIDPPTGDMYIADVGASKREEIDYVPGNRAGLNFGWPCYEGHLVTDPGLLRLCKHVVSPILDYPHTKGQCAIIGGVVARDPRLPTLRGRYLYTDLCNGDLRSLQVVDGKVGDDSSLGLRVTLPTAFGVDGTGRVYVANIRGAVYRFDPKG